MWRNKIEDEVEVPVELGRKGSRKKGLRKLIQRIVERSVCMVKKYQESNQHEKVTKHINKVNIDKGVFRGTPISHR